MRFPILLAGAAVVAIGTAALAQDDANPAVAARQAHMQLYTYNLGILGEMAQAKTEYNAEVAQAAADNLAAVAGLDQSNYWPEGTAEGTKAQPAIWENMDDFIEKQDGMTEAATAMATLAGVDLESLQSGMAGLGGACSACHREYRAR